MTFTFIIWASTNIIVSIATFGGVVRLYRSSQNTKHSPPIVAILIIGVTALITGLQFPFPEVLADCRRNQEALLAGEWWRMVTPLFVQAFGWWQCCINGLTAAILCPLAERFYGRRLLLLYFIPGISSEIFAYFWSPDGAGSSLGIAGVVGALFAVIFFGRSEIFKPARIYSIFGIVGAAALSFSRDNNGPPKLIGFVLARVLMILCPDESAKPTAGRHLLFSS